MACMRFEAPLIDTATSTTSVCYFFPCFNKTSTFNTCGFYFKVTLRLRAIAPTAMEWVESGAIIGDGDRKSWDSRGPMIWDNFSIFRTNCAILTSWIHARVVGCRVDVVTLRDQLVRVARFSCRFFTAMAGDKAERKNQGSSVYFYALM